jgi:hydrogenase nickel incorporation protein HypA/HybF
VHELSLAQSIVEIVQQYVPDAQRTAVESVRLKVGDQAGVVVDSLKFCFSAITVRTDLEGARLDIERVPFSFTCKTCSSTCTDEMAILLCPHCGGHDVTILSGTELQVTEIQLHDHVAEAR